MVSPKLQYAQDGSALHSLQLPANEKGMEQLKRKENEKKESET
jgi:hypothetical protein